MEERIVDLVVETGERFNPETREGAIASLGGFRGELVFLPQLPTAVAVGSKVRVVLEEIPKKDSRGRTMWRAKPAPDFVEEVWEQVVAEDELISPAIEGEVHLRGSSFTLESFASFLNDWDPHDGYWGAPAEVGEDGKVIGLNCACEWCCSSHYTFRSDSGRITAEEIVEAIRGFNQAANRDCPALLNAGRGVVVDGGEGEGEFVVIPSRPAVHSPQTYSLRRLGIRRNWIFAEIRRETLEERPAAKRDGQRTSVIPTREYLLVFGEKTEDSVVMESSYYLIPEEQERVEGGKLVWEKVGEHRAPEPDREFPLEAIDVEGSSLVNRFNPRYENGDAVELKVTFNGQQRTLPQRWGDLPSWLQAQFTQLCPLCLCSRQRRKTQEDGYAKCELCRAEEVCERCGAGGSRVSLLYGKLICEACKPQATLELMVDTILTDHHRQLIAEEAKRLKSGQAAFTGPEGETILGASSDHAGMSRSVLIRKWSGYGWYYFAEHGTFGSKFAPAALELLGLLPQATGEGLLELVAWIVGGVKPDVRYDYYLRSQIKGEEGLKPTFAEDQLRSITDRLDSNESVLADWLRGGETDRQKMIELLGYLESSFPGWGGYLLSDAIALSHAERQDYKMVCTQLEEVVRLFQLLQREYSFCPLCGLEWADEHGEKVSPLAGKCKCQPVGKKEDAWREVPLMRSLDVDGRVLVTAKLKYGIFQYGYVETTVEIEIGDIPFPEIDLVRTERLKTLPQLDEARKRFQAEGFLASELRACEGKSPSRVKCEFVADPDRPGKLYADTELAAGAELTGYGRDDKEYRYSSARFICDPSRCSWLSGERPKAGQTWVCSTGKMIGLNNNRPIIVVNPQVRVDGVSLLAPADEGGVAPEGDATIGDLASKWGARIVRGEG